MATKSDETKKEDFKFDANTLANSKAMSKYQKEFVKVVLKDGQYTIKEAISKVENYLKQKPVGGVK